jgi:hypothetical protein
MVEAIIFSSIQHFLNFSSSTSYSMWQRGQAVSIAERCGQFEPNLLTMHGDTQTHDIRAATAGLMRVCQPFPLFSRSLITAPASECRAPTVPGTTPCRGCKALPFVLPRYSTGRGTCVEGRVPQVLGLPLTQNSRYVIGTFKACHSTTTPFDLSIFSSTQTGQTTKPSTWHHTNPRPSTL